MKSLDRFLNLLIGLALLFNVGAYFYFKPKKPIEFVYKQPTQDSDVDKVVNKYIQLANDAKNLEKLRLDRAAFEATKKIMADREQEKLTKEEKSARESKIVTRAEVDEMAKKYKDNPNAVTQPESGSSAGEFDLSKLTPEEKTEYKRQYIENAKNGGYLIELNERMEIIKATPIRKPSQQNDEGYTGPEN